MEISPYIIITNSCFSIDVYVCYVRCYITIKCNTSARITNFKINRLWDFLQFEPLAALPSLITEQKASSNHFNLISKSEIINHRSCVNESLNRGKIMQ